MSVVATRAASIVLGGRRRIDIDIVLDITGAPDLAGRRRFELNGFISHRKRGIQDQGDGKEAGEIWS